MKKKLFVLGLAICLLMAKYSFVFADPYDIRVGSRIYALVDLASDPSDLADVAADIEIAEVRLSDGNFYSLLKYSELKKQNMPEADIIKQLGGNSEDFLSIVSID